MSFLSKKKYFIKHVRFWDWKKYIENHNSIKTTNLFVFKISRSNNNLSNILTFVLKDMEKLSYALNYIDLNNENIIDYDNLKNNWSNFLPKNFQWRQYKELYLDLQDLDEDEVKNHYILYGNYENRIYRKIFIPENQMHLLPFQKEINYNINLLSSKKKILKRQQKILLEKRREQEKKENELKIKLEQEEIKRRNKELREKKLKKLKEEEEERNRILKLKEEEEKQRLELIEQEKNKIINVIIRYNNNPEAINKLIDSLNNQSCKKYKVFIAINISYSIQFLVKQNIRNIKDFIVVNKLSITYNDIFEYTSRHIKDGYVMYLEDCDFFLLDNGLQMIFNEFPNKKLITWNKSKQKGFCIKSNLVQESFWRDSESMDAILNSIFTTYKTYHLTDNIIHYEENKNSSNVYKFTSEDIIDSAYIDKLPSKDENICSNVNSKTKIFELPREIMPCFTECNFYNKYLKNLVELPIFYINLDRSEDRNNLLLKNIKETSELFTNKNIKLNVKRISAIDGKIKNILHNQFMDNIVTLKTDSELGCLCSHLIAIKNAYEKGYELAFICEDDVDLKPLYNNYDLFLESTKYIDNNYEIIQTYVINQLENEKSSYNTILPFLHWDTKFYSTASYIITRKGMKRIVEFFFDGEKIRNIYMNIFVADLLLYSFCHTITSTIPLCNILPVISLIQDWGYSAIQHNAIVTCNDRNKVLANIKSIQKIPYTSNILKGDYLCFINVGDYCNMENWFTLVKESKLKIDIVICYYGNNEQIFNKLKSNCCLAFHFNKTKFDNFFYFFHSYKDYIDSSNYKRVAILNDNISIKTKNGNPLDKLFMLSEYFDTYLSGPIFNIDNELDLSDRLCHFNNFICSKAPIIRFDCLSFLMNICYNCDKIPSNVVDIFYMQIFDSKLKNKYLIIDDVVGVDLKSSNNETRDDNKWKSFVKTSIYH